jgi:hypothetical protein
MVFSDIRLIRVLTTAINKISAFHTCACESA